MTTATLDSTFPAREGGRIPTLAFGTTVAMWAVGYVGHLPALSLPGPVTLPLLLLCLLAGGGFAGRHARGGWRAGAAVGFVVGLLNLLILGSLITGDQPNAILPTAVLWVPGSVLASAAFGAAGGWFGGRTAERATPHDWPSLFARVAVGATFLLLGVGGLVTSTDTGLAVVDWPNSYGYNMFLYPLAKMTGGIYYEHAHRLFGALVGLTTVVLAVVLQRHDPRAWIRRLGWAATVMVVIQGLLGGLRVTGRFTLTTDPTEVAPNLGLAVVHGVFGQAFFALLVALAVFTSVPWRTPAAPRDPARRATDRTLGIALIVLLVLQLVLGALQRHTSTMLMFHITLACIVAPLAIALGARAWGLNRYDRQLHGFGLALMAVTAIQVVLGFGAYLATGEDGGGILPPVWEVTLATAHQWCGAALLALAVATWLWAIRPEREASGE
jgi:cytochrome c oxidase assembly protein subunit 15